MTGIYKITNPLNEIYIGKSKNIKNRYNYYKQIRCKTQKCLYQSILKYGWNSHIFEIIEELPNSTDDITLSIYENKYYNFYLYNEYSLLNLSRPAKITKNKVKIIRTKFVRKGVYLRKKQPIHQFDSDWKFIKTWESQKDASNILNINISKINSAVNDRRPQKGEFRWSKQKTQPEKVG